MLACYARSTEFYIDGKIKKISNLTKKILNNGG